MSVRERTREVGILKTLGFRQEAILVMFMGEAILMSIAGGITGLLLGTVLAAVVGHSDAAFATLRLGITADVAGFVIVIAALIGALSSVSGRAMARTGLRMMPTFPS